MEESKESTILWILECFIEIIAKKGTMVPNSPSVVFFNYE